MGAFLDCDQSLGGTSRVSSWTYHRLESKYSRPDNVTAYEFMPPRFASRPECQWSQIVQGALWRYAKDLGDKGSAPRIVITDVFMEFLTRQ